LENGQLKIEIDGQKATLRSRKPTD